MTTLRDVAKAAGVTIDQVARAINGKSKERWPSVAKKNDEIRRIAREMNYTPNRAAQMMRTRRSKQIGIIVTELYNPTTGYRLESFGEELAKRGYGLVLGLFHNPKDPQIGKFLQNILDGVINLHPELSTEELKKMAPDIPIITSDRSPEESPCVLNKKEGTAMAMDYLWKLGHRKMALVMGPENENHFSSRIAGYEAFYSRQTVAVNDNWIIRTNWTLEDGENAAPRFLETGCTACLAGNSLLAVGISNGLQDRQFKIPEDFSIFALEDSFTNSTTKPRISCIKYPIEILAQKTVEALIAQITDDTPPIFEALLPKLVERSSSGLYKNS